MVLKTAGLILGLSVSLLFPGMFAGGQENGPPSADEGKEDLAAIVRGLIVTWHDVEKEVAILRANPYTADMTDEMLRWQARSILAGNIILLDEAKQYTSKVSDDQVRDYWIVRREVDPSYVADNFEKLKDEFVTNFYVWARCGLTSLEGVVPDMASFIRVTPREIKDYYHNNLDLFSQKASTVLVWILFPDTAFGEPAEARRCAAQCRDLLQSPGTEIEDLAEEYASLAERWPGCIPRKTEIQAEEESSFHPSIGEFVDRAATDEVSDLIDLEGGVVIARIIEKTEGKVATFNEVQNDLAGNLKDEKMKQARLLIVQDLARKERFFFPSDLFERDLGRNDSAGRPAEK